MISYMIASLLVILTIDHFPLGQCELYTSVEELSRWPDVTRQFSSVLDELIRAGEQRLYKMHKIQESLADALSLYQPAHGEESLDSPARKNKSLGMSHPIVAFVTINKLIKAVEHADQLLDEQLFGRLDNSSGYSVRLTDMLNQFKDQLPSQEDLIGSGEAILRLQIFYNLKIDQLAYGHLPDSLLWDHQQAKASPINSYSSGLTIEMDADDCFELGRVAFLNERYEQSIEWLLKALELATTSRNNSLDTYEKYNYLVSNILEHMAFSAYKIGHLDYAILLTEAWLARDPDNDRAQDNLEYYEEEAEQARNQVVGHSRHEAQYQNETFNQMSIQHSDGRGVIDTENYSIMDDHIVQRLCLRRDSTADPHNGTLKCHLERRGWSLGPLRIEELNKEPKIIRIHEIISESEGDYIRLKALPRLQRSTIHSGDSSRSSDFRLAKTAWLPSETDEVIQQIESRLSSILDLSLESSEHLQVVNYGLGGFYGPHIDSARPTSEMSDEFSNVGGLKRSDRLATILIYLNQIEAGGSTVFPNLSVVATPIYRSAVVWFNLLESGWSDGRTVHTGCPVLLGSKWIATKWPREAANSFKRPCKL